MATRSFNPAVDIANMLVQPAESKFWAGLTKLQYGMLVVCVSAQTATILFTWPLWQVRQAPVHLPLIDLPQIPFGFWLLATLVVMLLRPRFGLGIHVTTLLISFVFDQFRTQPQFIATAVLMAATVDERGLRLVRWFLASLWTWAGLHKLLSPDWFSFNAWNMTSSLGLDPTEFGEAFGWCVGLGELSVGLLAILRPHWAAIPCALMHVGIVLFLSPLAYDWNYSVIPWNLCTAVVGCWLLASVPQRLPEVGWEWAAAAVMLIYPAGFYVGWVDHGVASVLYSGNLPDALITSESGLELVEGWGDLNVPFPNERRLLRQYFALSAPPGSKLHIADTRYALDDLYYVKKPDGQIALITLDEFHADAPGVVAGVGLDDQHSVFLLGNRGVVMLKRTEHAPIYAARIEPDVYRADLLRLLAGLPNLEQLDLSGCAITDADLQQLPIMPKLEGIGLADTKISDAGLNALLRQPKLTYVESEGSLITPARLEDFERKRMQP
ncbi:MauE/DoxX family redox-associated membrane protein [Blastopirellula marina]|uniref:Methylamine utilisation protein MauE domain-containing protein n=1 Tax=Blastopirellula marina DSM 3645 TaxID=314230 RepID=A3ZNC2_9BACT|nr:hypothetical protein [Blastopirellula marina]EAQ81817.1 hypothetical protein DSM3645_16735 [Blastopirellula marina DSM 3645]